MKKALLFGSALAVTFLGMSFESIERIEAVYNMTAAPAGHTGSPGDGVICTACHSGAAAITKTGIITTNIPLDGYVPGNAYTITVTLENPGTTRFGFQLSPQNQSGAMLGSWGTATTETQVIASKWVTHKMAGTVGTGSRVWNLDWIAPVAGTGDVTFYGAFNISNSNNTTTGDIIWKSSLQVSEQGTSNLATAGRLEMDAFVDGNNHLQVRMQETNSSNTQVRLVDLNGKLIQSWTDIQSLDGQWHAELPTMSAGIYVVQVQSGAKEASKKIVVY